MKIGSILGIAFCGLLTAVAAQAREPRLPVLSEILSKGSPLCPGYQSGSFDVCRLNQFEAQQVCRRHGGRLPTVRELAQFAQHLGARGIRETEFRGSLVSAQPVRREIDRSRHEDYYPIFRSNRYGKATLDFYFDHSGYERRPRGLGDLLLWSSSVYPGSVSAYAVNGSRGTPVRARRDHAYLASAVRCVM